MPDAALAVVRRGQGVRARAGGGAGDSSRRPGSSTPTASPRRLDDRRAGSRRSPVAIASTIRRSAAGSRPPVVSLPSGRDRGPRRARTDRCRAGETGHDLRARRADLGRVRAPAACSTTTAGSARAIADRSTPTATSSSRAAPTTRSSAAARTSRPAEIEEVLLAHPAVAEACVVGLPDDEWGQRIVAAVVLTRRSRRRPPTSCATRSAPSCAAQDARADRVPRALPHTDTGKMLRRVVLEEIVADGAICSASVGQVIAGDGGAP